MILPGNASLIISAVQHLVKLTGRIDNLMAEREAVQSALVLGMPQVATPDLIGNIQIARRALTDTAALQPDPFGADRAAFQAEIDKPQPGAAFGLLFNKYFPDTSLLVDPDALYLGKLRQSFPGLDWKNPGVRIAAFVLVAGPDDRQIGYNGRLALSVADTLLEFGAENTALFVRDEKLRGIAQTVLARLAQPDWGSFENWNPLLQSALKAVLNAALDVADKNPVSNPWLESTLDALVQARSAAADPDDFLLGLLHGRGVNLLLGKGLLVASEKLDDANACLFRQIAADVLTAAVPLVQDPAQPGFRAFFNDHWGDLLRAGLSSIDKHGDALLAGQNPLLRDVLKALVQQLATTPDAGFLTNETLFRLADTAIGVVADNPAEIPGLATKPWLRDFIAAAANSAKTLTAKKLLTPAAAEALVLDAVGVLAKYPHLVVAGNGLPLTLATGVFAAVAQLPRLDARAVGETALRAALAALGADPSLASGKFGPVVVAVATQLAGLVGQKQFTAAQAAALASVVIQAVARNPRIYASLQKDIAGAVVGAVQQAIPANAAAAPWAGRLLVEIARETLLAVSRHGATVAANQTAAQLQQLLTTILTGGLTTAANQLGATVDLDDIAPVLGGLVAGALRGDLTGFDPQNPAFVAAFQKIAAARLNAVAVAA